MTSLKFLFVLALLHLSSGKTLPDFIKICKKSSPNLLQCIEDNANYAMPYIFQGVKELNISPLKNLKLPKISAPSYVSYNFNFEGNITNLEGATFNITSYDSQDLVCRSKLIFPTLTLVGNYTIDGFVAKIPISGKGPANITLHNTTLDIYWTVGLYKRHGLNYYQQISVSLISYSISSVSYKFQNLFDGDKVQDETANEFLNKYWWILGDNFLPYVPVYLIQLVYEVTTKVTSHVTTDKIVSPL